jgi:hypothetical protein
MKQVRHQLYMEHTESILGKAQAGCMSDNVDAKFLEIGTGRENEFFRRPVTKLDMITFAENIGEKPIYQNICNRDERNER